MRTNKFKAGMYSFLIGNIAIFILHMFQDVSTTADWYMIIVIFGFLGVVEAIEIAADRITNE